MAPRLPRSVGFRPVFFPPERRLGHAAVHAQPAPVDALQVVVGHQARLPQRQEHAGLCPLLEAVMGRGAGAELGGVQRLPGDAGAQHKEDGVQAHPVRGARLTAAEGMGVHMLGQGPFDLRPEVIRNAPGLGTFEVVHKSAPGVASGVTSNVSRAQEL